MGGYLPSSDGGGGGGGTNASLADDEGRIPNARVVTYIFFKTAKLIPICSWL